MRKILDWTMWFMFLVSFIITIMTMAVFFGKYHISQFNTLLPLEISLAATFILWGINSRYNAYIRFGKNSLLYSLTLGGILVACIFIGIY